MDEFNTTLGWWAVGSGGLVFALLLGIPTYNYAPRRKLPNAVGILIYAYLIGVALPLLANLLNWGYPFGGLITFISAFTTWCWFVMVIVTCMFARWRAKLSLEQVRNLALWNLAAVIASVMLFKWITGFSWMYIVME